jgi:hypothetical protein
MNKKELAKAQAELKEVNFALDVMTSARAFVKLLPLVATTNDRQLMDDVGAIHRVLTRLVDIEAEKKKRGKAARVASAAARTKATTAKLNATADVPRQKERARRIGVHPTTLARAKTKKC